MHRNQNIYIYIYMKSKISQFIKVIVEIIINHRKRFKVVVFSDF